MTCYNLQGTDAYASAQWMRESNGFRCCMHTYLLDIYSLLLTFIVHTMTVKWELYSLTPIFRIYVNYSILGK